MADSHSLNETPFQNPDPTSPLVPTRNPVKTLKNFVIFILVLVVLPLFPSQAPEFFNQTILTKVWELIYLLFIGIVVSYGLFSRTSVKLNSEACSNLATVKPQIWSPLNGILQISSIFEEGFENSSGFDEWRIPQIFSPFSKGVYSKGYSVVDNCENFRSSAFISEFGNFNSSNGKKVGQPVDSQSVVEESVVFDQFGKPKSNIEHKPLGLPIRSLRSKNLDPVGLESISASGSGLSFKSSCFGDDRVGRGRVRGMAPTNLEGVFKEAVAPSPIPWCSRPARMEMREEMDTLKSHSQFRPTSNGEFESECLNSRSFRSSMPSHSSNHSSSGMSSFASIPSDFAKLKMEDLKGKEKEKEKEKFDGSRPPPSLQPSLAPLSGNSSIRSSSTRHFSIGSTSEMNVHVISREDWMGFRKSSMDTLDSSQKPDALVRTHSKGKIPVSKMEDLKGKEKLNGPQLQSKQPSLTSFNGVSSFKNSNARSLSMGSSAEVKVQGVKNYLKDFLETKEDNLLGREKQTKDFSKLSQKPAALVNGYTPGKSVRTIRSSEKLVEAAKETGKVFPRSIDDKFDMKFAKGDELKNKVMGIKGNFDNILERTKFENFGVSSDEEEAGLDMFSDAEPHSGEVDRRADEFIAKFKEQIRLQKMASRRLNF